MHFRNSLYSDLPKKSPCLASGDAPFYFDLFRFAQKFSDFPTVFRTNQGNPLLPTPLLSMREIGAICQMVVLTQKQFILECPKRADSAGSGHCQDSPSQILSPFEEKQVFKRQCHKPKYIQMLCFVVFGRLDQIDMMSKLGQQSRPRPQKARCLPVRVCHVTERAFRDMSLEVVSASF